MENWHHRDLCINRSLQGEGGEGDNWANLWIHFSLEAQRLSC